MVLKYLLPSVLALAARSTAQLDEAFAAAHSCNSTCFQAVSGGALWERSQHPFPNDPFYEAPWEKRPSKAGEIVRVQNVTDVTNYTIPSSQSMSRIVYTTENINGTVIPASAYILWPHTPYVAGAAVYKEKSVKFQSILWAHGTTGVHSNCNPSNYQHLQYNWMIPFTLAAEGFAIVAPDYQGLGVHTGFDGEEVKHPYLLGPAAANDLAFAMVAAKKAFPGLLKEEFVAMGHSQGGYNIWAFAQRQADKAKAIKGYLGTTALSPGTSILDLFNTAFKNVTDPLYTATVFGGVQQFVNYGVTAAFPSFNMSGLTKIGSDGFQVLMKAGGCLPTNGLISAFVAGLPVNPGWYNNPTALKYFDLAKNGGRPFKGPMLVLASKADPSNPYVFSEQGFNQTCDLLSTTKDKDLKKESIEFRSLEGLGHFDMITGSRPIWMEWVKARFAGIAPAKTCTKNGIPPYGLEATKHWPTPNWLLSVITPLEGWKGIF